MARRTTAVENPTSNPNHIFKALRFPCLIDMESAYMLAGPGVYPTTRIAISNVGSKLIGILIQITLAQQVYSYIVDYVYTIFERMSKWALSLDHDALHNRLQPELKCQQYLFFQNPQ